MVTRIRHIRKQRSAFEASGESCECEICQAGLAGLIEKTQQTPRTEPEHNVDASNGTDETKATPPTYLDNFRWTP